MADARIVPSSLSKQGNVVAFIERLDGSALAADISVIGFADISVLVRMESPDGRIYFSPPGGLDGSVSEVSLPSGDVLTFDSDATYVDDQLACVQALRAQMSVLRRLTEATVEADRDHTLPEDIVEARYWAVLSAGHLLFGDAIEGVDNAAQPADLDEVDAELNAFADEHASELESFQKTSFPQGMS